MTPRRRFSLLLAGALLAPACGNNNPTIPDVTRAVIDISVSPNPAVGTQNALTGSVSAPYKITITETNGLGGDVSFVSAAVYDPVSGKQVALNYYDGSDLVVYVGSKHIDPLGTLVVPQTASYTLADLSKAANLSVSVQLVDDRKNLVMTSVLVKIE
jgi:hypothetical protein